MPLKETPEHGFRNDCFDRHTGRNDTRTTRFMHLLPECEKRVVFWFDFSYDIQLFT